MQRSHKIGTCSIQQDYVELIFYICLPDDMLFFSVGIAASMGAFTVGLSVSVSGKMASSKVTVML